MAKDLKVEDPDDYRWAELVAVVLSRTTRLAAASQPIAWWRCSRSATACSGFITTTTRSDGISTSRRVWCAATT